MAQSDITFAIFPFRSFLRIQLLMVSFVVSSSEKNLSCVRILCVNRLSLQQKSTEMSSLRVAMLRPQLDTKTCFVSLENSTAKVLIYSTETNQKVEAFSCSTFRRRTDLKIISFTIHSTECLLQHKMCEGLSEVLNQTEHYKQTRYPSEGVIKNKHVAYKSGKKLIKNF